jgi:hypothetical protein
VAIGFASDSEPDESSAMRRASRLDGSVVEPLAEDPAMFDPAVARVREAGGPVDRACYTCHCGYLFVARVSTTVTCPHCGSRQAW